MNKKNMSKLVYRKITIMDKDNKSLNIMAIF